MDHAWTLVGLSVLAVSLTGLLRKSSPPCFLMQEWSGAEVLALLGPLDRSTVESVFDSDMRRAGRPSWGRKLPPADAAHYLPVMALSSQIGLALRRRTNTKVVI